MFLEIPGGGARSALPTILHDRKYYLYKWTSGDKPICFDVLSMN